MLDDDDDEYMARYMSKETNWKMRDYGTQCGFFFSQEGGGAACPGLASYGGASATICDPGEE